MKQHITVKQLNELSDKGKEKLIEWFLQWDNEDVNEWSEGSYREGMYLDNGEFCPFLSIGQMIEFLLTYTANGKLANPSSIEFEADEDFCDLLWDKVKDTLTLESGA